MKIKISAVSDVRPYDKNPRNHDVDAIAKSIEQFGWRQPIVVDSDGVIIAGHGRFFAAQQLQLAKVPVHVATDLTAEQIRAYRLADNQTNELGGWNLELLAEEIEALKELDVDLASLGFDEDELAKLLNSGIIEGDTDPDDVPDLPLKAKTKLGDVWILGDHRLMCGDSSKAADVDRLLAAQAIQLCYMDPPYNVAVQPRTTDGKRKPVREAKDRPLLNDSMPEAEFDKMLNSWFGNVARVLQPGRSFYIWGGFVNCANYPPALKANKLKFAQSIIWHKQHPVMNRKDFMCDHEWCFRGHREGKGELPDSVEVEFTGEGLGLWCFYGWREGAAHIYLGPKNATDVWSVKKVNPNQMVHLTQKPVELGIRAMQYSSRPGENVLDLFGGSGSTMIAAQQTGRKAFLMELDPLYCDVIVKRFEEFTGDKPKLESTKNAKRPSGRAKPSSQSLPA